MWYKLKRILIYPDGVTEKQVYPAWWKPNANTLIYYPLTSNLVDQMWNWNTGTMHWTCTFDSSTGIHVTWKSWNYITGMSNWIANRNTFTMNVWEKLDQTGKTQCILWYNNNSPSSQCMYISHEWDGYRWVWFFWSSWSYCVIWNITIDTNWHNVCLLATWTSYQWYIDWVAYWTAALSSNNMNNYSELQLWWWGAYWSNRAANWYIRDYIVETVARTDAEILNYYNTTKSNYWL